MATEMKVWQVSPKDGLIPIPDVPLEVNRLESELESWIEKNPEILGDDLLVIDRQYSIESVGRLDLLCIDSAGTLVVVELKRDSTPREAVAQALDYASWMDAASELQMQAILDRAQVHLGKPLGDAFTEQFGDELPEPLEGKNHRLILVAPRLDAAAERIINYLASRYGMEINAVFFKYARLPSGEEILARSVLVPEEITEAKKSIRRTIKLPEILLIAEQRKVMPLLSICRQMNERWEEEAAGVYAGSLVYWAKAAEDATYRGGRPVRRRMVYGINVSGQARGASPGELDVWIPVSKLAEAAQVNEADIRSAFGKDNPPAAQKLWRRLSTPDQAEALVQQLKKWGVSKESLPAVA